MDDRGAFEGTFEAERRRYAGEGEPTRRVLEVLPDPEPVVEEVSPWAWIRRKIDNLYDNRGPYTSVGDMTFWLLFLGFLTLAGVTALLFLTWVMVTHGAALWAAILWGTGGAAVWFSRWAHNRYNREDQDDAD